MHRLLRSLLVALAGFVLCFDANSAGFSSSSSQAGEETHFKPEQVIAFAKKVERTMAAKGARVAILARMGRPPAELPEGMHFTHVAFAVYSEITTSDGRKLPGYSIYNLYQEDGHPDVSDLVQDFPVDFFAGVAQLEAGIIIPSPALQERLLEVISSPTYQALHDPHYSVIANPYTTASIPPNTSQSQATRPARFWPGSRPTSLCAARALRRTRWRLPRPASASSAARRSAWA